MSVNLFLEHNKKKAPPYMEQLQKDQQLVRAISYLTTSLACNTILYHSPFQLLENPISAPPSPSPFLYQLYSISH